MNEDAFARRFYADRSELESLRIQLTVDQPADGAAEQENYSLRPENFHLPAIEFTDEELAALQTALQPARRRIRLRRAAAARAAADHLGAPEPAARARAALGRARHHRLGRRPRALRAPGEDRDGDLPPQDDRVRLLHDGARRGRARAGSTPTTCSSRAGSSTCSATRTSARRSASSASRASAARSPTRPRPSTTSSAPRTSTRAPTPTAPTGSSASELGVAEVLIAERIAWQIERHFGRYGEIRRALEGHGRATSCFAHRLRQPAQARRLGARPRRARAPARARSSRGAGRRLELLERAPPRRVPRRPATPRSARRRRRAAAAGAPRRRAPRRRRARGAAPRRRTADGEEREPARGEAAIRPERFARLVTLASILIQAGRARRARAGRRGVRAPADQRAGAARGHQRAERRQLRRRLLRALRRDPQEDGEIEVDPEPYSDYFARPARLLPVEAKALVAAIDLIGEHIPEGSLASRAREDRRRARRGPDGAGPAGRPRRRRRLRGRARRSRAAIVERRLVELEYYKENEDEFSQRRVEPYALTNGREGWYVASLRPRRATACATSASTASSGRR